MSPTKWEITFEGITYRCIKCGFCCSCKNWRIYLSYFDYIKLREDYSQYIEDTKGPHFHKRLKVDKRGCLLLTENNLCRIQIEKGYTYKPTMCKLFPFSFRVKWNGDLLLIIRHYCRGIRIGRCSRAMIKHAIECCEELYMDQLERIRLMGMESSTRCKLDDKEYITWEEREELGRYIFSSPNLEELCRRYIEVGDLNISREITYIRRNIENNIRYPSRSIGYLNRFTSIEREIIRYLGELNRRELFRKLPLKDELYKLINIGIEVSSYRDILQGEGVIDLKILSLY
ncbi:MAG TPA: YkgJ family cysteine cluster protein [Methanothermococcus okinawensis]|uniref:YkgJ family cysteine cluster protein n=1 Tax=Methanothermococcus okinawensis TaxID=155863 RepID=A0A832ZI59_9EURY|nr:YkgJ family cysteine cluster protein [Methanococcaceae archaeon]HIP84756.1 YkgJ family cysteine cluster protein [Methanothermococcus okinawensis]HIP90947.1 YkgJ family cysteine cluster protein [Methanothermococcus okinawensis]